MTRRLGESILASLPGAIRQPAYDRAGLACGLVHLGLGAFHRAHQAVFTEDAIEAAGGDWGIVGVSLRSGAARAALRPQDGLYAVECLAEPPRTRVIGAVRQALLAPEAPNAVLDAIAAPATHVVTLTVTEAGYCLDAEGRLDFGHPDIVQDLAGEPHSAVGWLVAGLDRRRRAKGRPLTVVSCDNLRSNGVLLQAACVALASRLAPELAAWIGGNVSFPCAMVDCIVPAPDAAHRARVARALGAEDLASVQREAFAQWAIEDRFAGPRPAWDSVGVELVESVESHERLKLHVLNAAHSALAYLGLLRGLTFMRQAIAEPHLSAFADALIAQDVAAALPDLDVYSYWRGVRARLANPRLDHRLSQIGEDGSVKLAQRIYPLIIAGARAGRSITHLAAAVRAWLAAARQGLVGDVMGARLKAWAAAGGDFCAALDDPHLFPDPFRNEPELRAAVLDAQV